MSTNSTIVFPDPVLPLSNNNNNKVKDTANPDYPVVKSTADEKLSKVSSLSDPSSSCDGSSTVESEPSDSPDVTLKDLSILQVCQLLENQNLHSIKEVVVENEISGYLIVDQPLLLSQFHNDYLLQRRYCIVSKYRHG